MMFAVDFPGCPLIMKTFPLMASLLRFFFLMNRCELYHMLLFVSIKIVDFKAIGVA